LPDTGANPGLRSEKPATNRFSYGAEWHASISKIAKQSTLLLGENILRANVFLHVIMGSTEGGRNLHMCP
jgi:hypothetical protein